MTSFPSTAERDAALALLAAVKYFKDDEDADAFAACWSINAQLKITSNEQSLTPLAGRDAIMEFYRNVWKAGGHGLGHERETHVAEHPHITLIGSGRMLARHTAVLLNWREDAPNLLGYGEFRDEIIFEGGTWRIAVRHSVLRRQK